MGGDFEDLNIFWGLTDWSMWSLLVLLLPLHLVHLVLLVLLFLLLLLLHLLFALPLLCPLLTSFICSILSSSEPGGSETAAPSQYPARLCDLSDWSRLRRVAASLGSTLNVIENLKSVNEPINVLPGAAGRSYCHK